MAADACLWELRTRRAAAIAPFVVRPKKALAEDISKEVRLSPKGFGGITLAHNVSRKKEVAEVLALAEKAGARIVKPAQDTFWGGYSGYFTDLDGYTIGKSRRMWK